MLTQPVVALEYIRRRYPDQRVLAFGTAGVIEPLRVANIPVAQPEDGKAPVWS